MKILLADGNPISRVMISGLINACGHEVIASEDWAKTWALLQEPGAPPMAVLDTAMQGTNGYEICRRIRQQSGSESPYLLVMSAPEEHPARAFEAGADDVITKPINPAMLKARLQIALRIMELQARCAQALEPDSDHDMLTGVWSRRAILEFLHAQFARSARDGLSMALIVGDMDNFDDANAKYGRENCDALLHQVAQRLKRALRAYDSIGRHGGEEFLIIAPDCVMSNAQALAERIRILIADQPFEVRGKCIDLTISLGVATTAETGAMDESALLRAAGSALAAAKENGRNRVEAARRIPRQRIHPPRLTNALRQKELVQ